jgi:DNA-binding PadR family transcriptional regulator
MELEFVLLGLISMHMGVTGYELNRIMRESTGYLVTASLSHIYPSLNRLHERGLVSFHDLPIKNRLAKKVYQITPAGQQALQEWLCEPIEENALDFKPFCLKMSFSVLMAKSTILDHIDREIHRLEQNHMEKERGIQVEVDYLNKEGVDRLKAELLWGGINQVLVQTTALHLAWLKEWRHSIEQGLIENQ